MALSTLGQRTSGFLPLSLRWLSAESFRAMAATAPPPPPPKKRPSIFATFGNLVSGGRGRSQSQPKPPAIIGLPFNVKHAVHVKVHALPTVPPERTTPHFDQPTLREGMQTHIRPNAQVRAHTKTFTWHSYAHMPAQLDIYGRTRAHPPS